MKGSPSIYLSSYSHEEINIQERTTQQALQSEKQALWAYTVEFLKKS